MKQPKVTVTLAFALAQQAYEKLRDQENKHENALRETINHDPIVLKHRKNRKQIDSINKVNRKLETELSAKFKKTINIYESSVNISGKSKLPSVSEIKTELLMLSHIDGVEAKQLVTAFLERRKK